MTRLQMLVERRCDRATQKRAQPGAAGAPRPNEGLLGRPCGYDQWPFRAGAVGGNSMGSRAPHAPVERWAVAILLPLLACCARTAPVDYSGPTAGWASWGGNEGGMRYTPANQITPANVKNLKVAWTYRIGEPSLLPAHPTNPADIPGLLSQGITPELKRMPALEATPILAEGRLYLCSSTNRVVALDPQTGRELWSFDPEAGCHRWGADAVPRRELLPRRQRRRGQHLRQPHLHRHAGRAPDRPGCEGRQALRRLRRGRHGGPERAPRAHAPR